MAGKLVSASICKQQVVIPFLKAEGKNGNKIHERMCNVYTKANSRLNAYKWIKNFNEGCMVHQDKMRLGRASDLVNKETWRIVSCLLDNDCHLTISDLQYEIAVQYMYVNASRVSIYWILMNKLILMHDKAHPHTTGLPPQLLKNFKWEILEHPTYFPPPHLALPIFMPFCSWKLNYRVRISLEKRVFVAVDTFKRKWSVCGITLE